MHARMLPISLAFGLAALPITAHAQVTDGNFDTQAASVTSYCYNLGCPTGAWSLAGGAGFVKEGNPGWAPPPLPSASWAVFLQGGPTSIQQTITVPVTGSYVVLFRLGSRIVGPGVDGEQHVTVTLAGQVVAQRQMISAQPFGRHVSAAVTLTAATPYTLLFTGDTTGDHTAFLDTVAIVPAGSTTGFSYDALGRLTGVSHSGGANAGVADGDSYDAAGNRVQATVAGVN